MATPRRPPARKTVRKSARKSAPPAAPKAAPAAARGSRRASPRRPAGARPAAGAAASPAASSSPRAPARRSPKPGARPRPAPRPSQRARRALEAAAPSAPARVPRSRELVALENVVLAALDDLKATNVKVLDVRGLTDVADTMIVASGNSDRHVRAIAERVIERSKAIGRRPMGTEGTQDAEWVLVDLQDVLVHVMLPRVREFYALEQLWEAPAEARRGAAVPPAATPLPAGG